jgi:phosphatidylglycerol---prolipoprotein diacylglyceryl transferase
MLALAFVAQLVLLFWLLHRQGFATRRVVGYVVLLSGFGFLGAKVASIVFHGGLRSAEIELTGGLRYPGALLGIVAGGYLLRRMLPAGLTFARFADIWTPSFALACALGRLGCLMMSCCYGEIANLPWSIRYPRGSTPWLEHYKTGAISSDAPLSLPVHPFPLYLFAMEIGMLALTLWLQKRKAYDGQVILVFLALHGMLKFAIEFTRHPYSWMHQTVLPIALVALAILVLRARHEGPLVRSSVPA